MVSVSACPRHSRSGFAPTSSLRNAQEPDRSKLAITPKARSIAGAKKSGRKYCFDDGKFLDAAVYLGEIRTDEKGRLIFLGGHGVSASAAGTPAKDFANNDGWHDDVSDGPVTAVVHMGGRPIPVEPAWVLVAPPNYAPDLHGLRTMYDLLTDVYIQAGWIPSPARVSFTRDVCPILRRLARLQWVNQGFAVQFGWVRRMISWRRNTSRGWRVPAPSLPSFAAESLTSFATSTGTACHRFPGRGSTATR